MTMVIKTSNAHFLEVESQIRKTMESENMENSLIKNINTFQTKIPRSFVISWLFVLLLGIKPALASGPLKIGVIATLEGTYTILGEDAVRGVKMALAENNSSANVTNIQLHIGVTDASPESAIIAAKKLIDENDVDIIIGPLSGSEGIAIRDYAKTQPGVTFINGVSGAQETTYLTPSDNFFRFNLDGAQWSAGLGEYIYNEKGYRNIATVGEDYSFVYTQVFGLVTEFCAAGGEVSERLWVPLGTKDFRSIIAALPDDVDAIYLGLGGEDAINFLNQYQRAGGEANLIGGTIMVDGSVLNSEGSAKEALIGTPSAGPQADTWDDDKWKDYVLLYQSTFPPEERFSTPSLFATGYYNATTATLECIKHIDGELSEGHIAFRACLSDLELDAPNGVITLDENRQAIGTNFVSEVVELDDGTLATEVLYIKSGVNQTLGIDPNTFKNIGLPDRRTPECKSSY